MDISIIVPNYNRKHKLRECLESLLSQDYPQEGFEVIVIDDGSNDGTDNMLSELSHEHPNLRYFLQPHSGPAASRNRGIKEAKSEIIAFTDNDCIVSKDWAKKMVDAHRLEAEVMAIGGLTRVYRGNIKALVSQFLSDGAINANIEGRQSTIFFPTCNVSIKKQYLGAEGFKEVFPLPAGEDSEFFWRFFKRGKRFKHRKDIAVFHNCNDSFRSFLRQAYMYGRGNYLVQYIHKDHPLFTEIKTKNSLVFILGTIVNFLKIPRFAYLLGRGLIDTDNAFNINERVQIYFYFAFHKMMYLLGNIDEHYRLLNNTDEYFQGIAQNNGGLAKPEFIILDVTHRCNLKCNICEIRKDRSSEELKTEEIKDLIDQAREWGVSEFVLSGGEPFVREDIWEILDFVKERNFRIGVLTNGILLNEDFIKRLLPYLSCDALSLNISIDAMTPSIQDDIRGSQGCFERTMHGLTILSDLKIKHSNINFNTISIILNENLEELLPLVNLLKSLRVNSIQLQPLLSNNLIMKQRQRNIKYWVPGDRLTVLDNVIDSLIAFKKQNAGLLRNSGNNLRLIKKYFRGLLSSNDIKCHYITKTMLIANNGDATTCFGGYGNIRDKALQALYMSDKSLKMREAVSSCKAPCLLPCFTDN